LAIVDTKSDSVMTEFGIIGESVTELAVSGNGDWAAVGQEGGLYVWDLNTQTLLWNRQRAFYPCFLSNGSMMVNTPDSIIVYDHSFNQKTGREGEIGWPQRFGREDLVIGIDSRPDPEFGYENSKLTIVNVTTMEEVDSIVMDPDSTGVGLHIFHFVVNRDASRIYALGFSRRADGRIGVYGWLLLGYEIEAKRVLFAAPVDEIRWSCRLSPDETELWYIDTWEALIPNWRWGIFVRDAFTGDLVDSVSTGGLYPDTIPYSSDRYLDPQDIQFERTGEKVYVSCGAGSDREPIMVIDRASKDVIGLIFADFLDRVLAIDVAP